METKAQPSYAGNMRRGCTTFLALWLLVGCGRLSYESSAATDIADQDAWTPDAAEGTDAARSLPDVLLEVESAGGPRQRAFELPDRVRKAANEAEASAD